MPLVVDETWGAHLRFCSKLPVSALECDADVVLSSVHKLVGSITQSAIVHLGQSDRLDEVVLDRAVTLVESTSPNALLTASLDAARRQARTYSGGMRRRLDLAAGLVGSPEPGVFFLDEPTTGLDPRSRRELWQVVRDLAGRGAAVLLTTQYLEEVDQLADRVTVLQSGAVLAEGPYDEVRTDERVITAYLGQEGGAHHE